MDSIRRRKSERIQNHPPRVIKETIKKDLPEGFQRSEFLLEHGFLDFIVDRKELKNKLSEVAYFFRN